MHPDGSLASADWEPVHDVRAHSEDMGQHGHDAVAPCSTLREYHMQGTAPPDNATHFAAYQGLNPWGCALSGGKPL